MAKTKKPLNQINDKNQELSSFCAAADSYLSYYAAGATHTARAKRLDVNRFRDFLTSFSGYARPEKLRLGDWDHSAVERFVEQMLSQGEAPATVARRLATIKHMGRALSEQIPGFSNPAKNVRSPKVQPLKPKGLDNNEVVAIREKASLRLSEKNSFIRLRNQTLFCFLIDTGIRADEARLLRLGQLDSELSWVQNVRTKGRRYRNVYITTPMRPLLTEYLAARKDTLKRFYHNLNHKDDRSLPVFISTYNAAAEDPDSFLMGAKTLWRAINELSAGIQLHPHLLRHSYALELLGNSNDVRLVAQALGHSDVRITMRYTERRDEEIAQALEKTRRARRHIV